MIVAKDTTLFGAPVMILGQDEGDGSGGGFDWKGLMSSAKTAIGTAQDAYKSINSGGKPAGATATTKAPVAPTVTLAPGADWSKVRVFIAAPTCASEYKALVALHKQRTASSAFKSYQQKRMAGTPLTQNDLVISRWVADAGQKIKDFTSKYGPTSTTWPTTCTGVKVTAGSIGSTGVTTTTAVVGLAVIAGIGLVVWKLL